MAASDRFHRRRFERVETFLEYLYNEENNEREKFSLHKHKTIIGREIVPDIRKQFHSERHWIEKRISQNAERQPDDELLFDDRIVEIPVAEDEAEQFELFDSKKI